MRLMPRLRSALHRCKYSVSPSSSISFFNRASNMVAPPLDRTTRHEFRHSFDLELLQMCVERVVEKRRALEDLRVVHTEIRKSLADGPEPRGLARRVHLGREVGSMDDLCQPLERFVFRESLPDQHLERASPPIVAMRISCAGRVESDGSFALLDGGHLPRLDEEDLGFRIQKLSNQPAGCRPVDVNAFARDPLHSWR